MKQSPPVNSNHFNELELESLQFPRKQMNFFGDQRAFNTNYPKLGNITLAETRSNVTHTSILENRQFGRVSGCCYGYCDKFCDWWI